MFNYKKKQKHSKLHQIHGSSSYLIHRIVVYSIKQFSLLTHTTNSRILRDCVCVCGRARAPTRVCVAQIPSICYVFCELDVDTKAGHIHTNHSSQAQKPELLLLWFKVKEMQQVNWSRRGQRRLISLLSAASFKKNKKPLSLFLLLFHVSYFCLWQWRQRHFLESSLIGVISFHMTPLLHMSTHREILCCSLLSDSAGPFVWMFANTCKCYRSDMSNVNLDIGWLQIYMKVITPEWCHWFSQRHRDQSFSTLLFYFWFYNLCKFCNWVIPMF